MLCRNTTLFYFLRRMILLSLTSLKMAIKMLEVIAVGSKAIFVLRYTSFVAIPDLNSIVLIARCLIHQTGLKLINNTMKHAVANSARAFCGCFECPQNP